MALLLQWLLQACKGTADKDSIVRDRLHNALCHMTVDHIILVLHGADT